MKISRRLAAVLIAVASVLTALLFAAAPAQAAASACNTAENNYCLAPSIVTLSTASPNCTPFSNGKEYQVYNNPVDGVQQDWTYSNGTNACIQVNYTTSAAVQANQCAFYFYVPQDGNANADIVFGWWDQSGVKHYATLFDESPVYGWQVLHMNGPNDDIYIAGGVTRISFQDNNGQTPGADVLGWGDSASYGIDAVC